MKNPPFVCIVTYGRSGSTVLQTVLQSIPGYHICGENMNVLYSLFGASSAAYSSRYEHGNKEHSPEDPWYGADKIVPERFSKKLTELFVEEIIQPPRDARVIGFKEIRFHEAGPDKFEDYLNFIHENLAPCKFIFNVRNWEDVSKSGWWASMNPDVVKGIVENCDHMYAEYGKKYPDRCIQMSYDETRNNPQAFKALFDFLGEPFEEDRIAEITGRRLSHTGV
ncbi:sulfotransferase [Kordiimonas sp. SCSIO 12603]|uniref:sulfotransferase n=1 Tax=Kordiimonas sp. SCSIO 12603 TaxID=2829596 RepID=UPI002102E6E6|nr:sulfotransferase [Kordiimonas sp. SCSIO 12603]UTW60052.1 sulfotransferase [Kordiimonas sp. SCSIO 12603]